MVRDITNFTKSNDGKISVHDAHVLIGKSIFQISLFLQMEGVAIFITSVYMWCTHLFIYIFTRTCED